MKQAGILCISLLLMACSQGEIEELAFRKTLEYSLVDLCGEEDKACIAAVESQLKGCMEKSNWQQYLNNDDDEEELKRFSRALYSCIVDEEGKPYFQTDL